LLQTMASEWPFFATLLSNMDMVLAKSDIGIAARYKDLVEDAQLREAIFSRLRSEYDKSRAALLAILGQQTLLERNPALARTIRDRFPYIDPLNHVQLELLKRYRAGDTDERVVQAIHLTINGIAAGLRNSGERRNEGTVHWPKIHRHHLPDRRAAHRRREDRGPRICGLLRRQRGHGRILLRQARHRSGPDDLGRGRLA